MLHRCASGDGSDWPEAPKSSPNAGAKRFRVNTRPRVFQSAPSPTGFHLFEEGELQRGATIRKFRIVKPEGARSVERELSPDSVIRKFRITAASGKAVARGEALSGSHRAGQAVGRQETPQENKMNV
jgi:hypothetical protein